MTVILRSDVAIVSIFNVLDIPCEISIVLISGRHPDNSFHSCTTALDRVVDVDLNNRKVIPKH